MQTISYIICNSGDGSNHIMWFDRELTEEEARALEESDYERYSSGDGLQYSQMSFPDEFSIEGWAGINYIKLNKYEDVAKDFELDLED